LKKRIVVLILFLKKCNEWNKKTTDDK